MNNSSHTTKSGLEQIVSIKAALNRGFSDNQKVGFPNIVSIDRPIVLNQKIPNPNWISRFAYG